MRNDLVDVISKTHVHHSIRLIQDQVSDMVQFNVAQIEVGNQLARCCYNDVYSLNQRFLLLIPARAISPSINGK